MPRDSATPAGLGIARVSHAYGERHVVDAVSLTVPPGELFCLVGPSGCGKTTLLRLAAGLETLQSGAISVDAAIVARPGHAEPPERRKIGMVFQDFALFPHLSVADNVGFGLDRLPSPARAQRVREMLTQVGLDEVGRAFPHQLSGGQQQRVALARALAPHPRVMLLDEPFSGLDTRLRERIREETRDVLTRSGVATLMVTHDPEEAMFMADHIAVMRDGRIAQQGRPDDIYARPASAFVAAFFGQVNELRGRVLDGAVMTPFGPVAALGLAEGSEAEVLIRPEGLRLSSGTCRAKVISARLLGRSTWLRLAVGAQERQFHARVPDRIQPVAGEIVAVSLDTAQAFVFPGPHTK